MAEGREAHRLKLAVVALQAAMMALEASQSESMPALFVGRVAMLPTGAHEPPGAHELLPDSLTHTFPARGGCGALRARPDRGVASVELLARELAQLVVQREPALLRRDEPAALDRGTATDDAGPLAGTTTVRPLGGAYGT